MDIEKIMDKESLHFTEPVGRAGKHDEISFAEAFRTWLRIGLLGFGGPAGQIALMHRILVEEKKWISESRFLHALNYCMLLPGPEAQQLATYVGWLLHRAAGGLAAGILFVLPGALVVLILSILYAGFRDVTFIEAAFFGIKAAVLAIVFDAVLRIGRRALKTTALVALAAAAFVGIFFLSIPFPVIVVGAGICGLVGGRLWPAAFIASAHRTADRNGAHAHTDNTTFPESRLTQVNPSVGRAAKILAICLALWFAPVIGLGLLFGGSSVFVGEGLFFSKMAVVTFGGAYAVLAYVAQEAVETHGWLAPGEMLDGLGLAETTPGPLILVLQFVGFLGAYRNPGALDPMLAGIVGAMLTTWVTFVPCFLWIFLGAPYVEKLRGNRALTNMLTGITAAIVGVIMNLALWFGLHVIFGTVTERELPIGRIFLPELSSVSWPTLALSAGAVLAVLRFKTGLLPTLGASALIGIAFFYLG